MNKRELVILGGGPGGYTAGIYGKRAGLDVLIIEKGRPGGQINLASEIENFPGTVHATGRELGDAFRDHAEHLGVELLKASIDHVELDGSTKVVKTSQGDIEADAVIVATGASYRKIGCPGEDKFRGAGVSNCAVCDGAFFEDMEIAVVGGGNSAVEEAAYLTRFASRVYLIHRRDAFRADHAALDQANANPKIVPVLNTVVEAIEGDGVVERLVLKNVKTEAVTHLPVAGVFVFVGMIPNSGPVANLVETTPAGWIRTNRRMETSVEGIFAAGDVRDTELRQVITAAGDGATAAMTAYHYIAEQLHLQSVLLKPERVYALFSSSIDQAQVRLAARAEEIKGELSVPVQFVDGYRNDRIVKRLGITELPAMVEINSSEVVRCNVVNDLDGIKLFCSA